jgi:flagellar biosynthesis protein FlhB
MSDRTEAPTSQRLEKARSEGQVLKSIELNTVIVMLAGVFLLQGPGKSLIDSLKLLLVQTISSLPYRDLTQEKLNRIATNDLIQVGPNLLVIIVILLLTGALVTLVQTRFLWASGKLGFQLNRLNPISNLKRFWSINGLVELAKATLKLVVVGWAAYSFVMDNLPKMLQLAHTDFLSALATWSEIAFALAMRIVTIYLVIAIADFAYQRWSHNKSLKMTKEEVKEEFIQQEGNPQIKGKIRQQQRRMARMRMMSAVPKANVIVTNPTHLAVAIQYDPETMTAPKVIAKGAHLVAHRIVAIAKEHGIPVVQNIPVARAIYRAVEIDQEIPQDLYSAMAEILVYVYRLKGHRPAFVN